MTGAQEKNGMKLDMIQFNYKRNKGHFDKLILLMFEVHLKYREVIDFFLWKFFRGTRLQ